MSETQPILETDRLTLEGLDTVFEDQSRKTSHTTGGDFVPISLKQATMLLSTDERSVLRLIKNGSLCARRNKAGTQWQIDANCLKAHLAPLEDTPLLEVPEEEETRQVHEVIVSSTNAVTTDLQAVLQKLAEAQDELHLANYRIGYLEAQIDVQNQQLELIPQLQIQSARSITAEKEVEELRSRLEQAEAALMTRSTLWERFCAWFIGKKLEA